MAIISTSISVPNVSLLSLLVLSSQVLHISSASTTNGCGFVPTIHVDITNNIGNIRIHCKSKDDDLGVQPRVYGQTYGFHFKPNAFATTLFFCAVMWDGKLEWFEAYKHKQDFHRCKASNCHCPWRLTPIGPCFGDRYSFKEYCVPWNKD
ncbi:hypothetical protein QQ045_012193 [Rhodiola kirilowii]